MKDAFEWSSGGSNSRSSRRQNAGGRPEQRYLSLYVSVSLTRRVHVRAGYCWTLIAFSYLHLLSRIPRLAGIELAHGSLVACLQVP